MTKPKRPPRSVSAWSDEWRDYLKAIGYRKPCYCKQTTRNTECCPICGGVARRQLPS